MVLVLVNSPSPSQSSTSSDANPFFRIPFYSWFRLIFLLYLIAPQTQGARVLYESHLHPFLLENELAIDDFISSAHERLKTAGLTYLKQLVELLKEHVLGIQPRKETAQAQNAPTNTLSYAQTLLNRFNLPSAKPAFAAAGNATAAYSLLANAVQAYAGTPDSTRPNLVPENIQGQERANFISQQRERIQFLLSALDREATQTPDPTGADKAATRASLFYDGPGMSHDGAPSSDSGLTKSMSVGDFEKIDGHDEDIIQAGQEESDVVKKLQTERSGLGTGSGWMPWSWGAKTPTVSAEKKVEGKDTGAAQEEDVTETSSGIDVLRD